MKLKQWAKKQGISYLTAMRWFHAGKIPNSYQMDTGTIIVQENNNVNEKDNIVDLLHQILQKLDEIHKSS